MIVLGFLLMCVGFGIVIIAWGSLMTRGWTGKWYERRH